MIIHHYISIFPFQKGVKEADTETSESDSDGSGDETRPETDRSLADNTNNCSTEEIYNTTTSNSTKRGDSGASANTPVFSPSEANGRGDQEHEEDQRETQLLDDAGASGMNFVVQQRNSTTSSVQLPAPPESASNPQFGNVAVPHMTFEDFLQGVHGQKPKTNGNEELDDYKLSSTESSEEEDIN